jgi:deoxyhypusine monooxygenase
MQDPETCAALEQVLAKAGEHPMVRHEAAEALGNIALEDYLPTITRFAQDPEAPVRESCEVALDYHRYMHSNEFEYADGLVQLRSK